MIEKLNLINKKIPEGFVTEFWEKKSTSLSEALSIIYETIIIDNNDSVFLKSNYDKYRNHINEYEKNTGNKFYNIDVILEWGGGYGGLCEQIRKINNFSCYVIIDLPVMIYFQYLYLTNCKTDCKILTSEDRSFNSASVNLLPITILHEVELPFPEMFISTWGISESGEKAIEYCKGFFDLNYLLIAMQKENSSDFPYKMPIINNAKIIDIDDNNKYLMR